MRITLDQLCSLPVYILLIGYYIHLWRNRRRTPLDLDE